MCRSRGADLGQSRPRRLTGPDLPARPAVDEVGRGKADQQPGEIPASCSRPRRRAIRPCRARDRAARPSARCRRRGGRPPATARPARPCHHRGPVGQTRRHQVVAGRVGPVRGRATAAPDPYSVSSPVIAQRLLPAGSAAASARLPRAGQAFDGPSTPTFPVSLRSPGWTAPRYGAAPRPLPLRSGNDGQRPHPAPPSARAAPSSPRRRLPSGGRVRRRRGVSLFLSSSLSFWCARDRRQPVDAKMFATTR